MLRAPQPRLQALHIEVDDRRDVEGQELADHEADDDGEAERLPRVRALTVAECDGSRTLRRILCPVKRLRSVSLLANRVRHAPAAVTLLG